jgi:predicted nucleic acid-binding protein
MKVYLDTCSLNRPLDDKIQPRVATEAEAILALLTLCEAGQLSLVSSDVLLFEVRRTPHPQRRTVMSEILTRAPIFIRLSNQIERRAKDLEQFGIKALDALHLASAEAENVDYFCSCDDRLIKRAKALSDFTPTVVTPLELIQEIDV